MPDIGSTLREARMRERIDISEVEAETKIRAKYLRAIENEEWDLLPGSVYAKSFLRSYGDYLGLDSRMLVEEFRRRYEDPSEHDIRPVASRPPRERERDRYPRRRRTPAWAPVAAVVVVILVVLYVVGTLGSSSSTSSPAAQKSAHHHHHHPVATRPKTTPAPRLPTKVTLRMVPTNPVYVCLVKGDGVKLINEQTYTVGQTVPTETGAKLLLTLGNNNMQLEVNGKSYPLAPSATPIRLLITPTAIKHIPSSTPPTCP